MFVVIPGHYVTFGDSFYNEGGGQGLYCAHDNFNIYKFDILFEHLFGLNKYGSYDHG